MHLSPIKVSYQRIESRRRVWLMRAVRYAGCSRASLFKLFLSEPLRLRPWRSHKSAVTGRGKHLYKSTRTVTQMSPAAQTHLSISVCLPQGLSHQLFSISLSLPASACISFLYSITKLLPSMDWQYSALSLKKIRHFQPTLCRHGHVHLYIYTPYYITIALP